MARRAWESFRGFHGFLWASAATLLGYLAFSWWREEPLSLLQMGSILGMGLISELGALLARESEPQRVRPDGPPLRPREVRQRLVAATTGTDVPDPSSIYDLLNRVHNPNAFRPIRALTDRYLLGLLTPVEFRQALRETLRKA